MGMMRACGKVCGGDKRERKESPAAGVTDPSAVQLEERKSAFTRKPTALSSAAAAAAAAAQLPEFTGKWQLSASRNFDEYLAAMGVNYLKRTVAAGMKPVQEWARVDGTWQFFVHTPLGLKVESFPLGVEMIDDVDGEKITKRTTWDGAVMHTAVVPMNASTAAKLGEMSMRRYLVGSSESAKLVLEMRVGSVICFREFTRVGAAPAPALAPVVVVPATQVPKPPKPDAEGGNPPDFSGKWQLSASRNFDEYLKAIGVSYVKRSLAAGMKPVQEWAHIDGTWQFSVSTPIGLRVEKFPLGVEVNDEVDGTRMVKLTSWERAVMNTAIVPKDAQKAASFGIMTMRRYLVGAGESAKLVLEMRIGDIIAFREFTRVA